VASLGSVRLTEDFETYAPSLDEIFERIWSNFGPWERPKGEQIRSLTVDLPISAEQAFRGGTVRLRVPALLPCPTCAGRGSVGFFECLRCSGQGKLVGSCSVAVAFPAGITSDYVTQLPLKQFGIRNLYLTVRIRLSEVMV
jgi:DnaJ-class molecular chaperone